MQLRTKRILLIIALLILIGLLGFALWYLFFRPLFVPTAPVVPQPPVAGLPTPPAAVLPTPPGVIPTVPGAVTPAAPVTVPGAPAPFADLTASGGITTFATLEPNPVVSPKLSTNGTDVVYYDTVTGFFYRISPDGQKALYSDAAFANVSGVTWAPDNRRAILEYPDGSNIIYNFQTKESITLPVQWKEFAFAPDGTRIAFKDMKLDKENRYITVTDTNGQGAIRIERLGDRDQDVHVTWSPNNQFVALYRQSIDIDRGEVTFIGLNDQNFRTVTVEGRDLRFAWSPSGRKMVYSVYNNASDYQPELWVTFTEPDLLGTGKNDLGIRTWADKCVYANENEIYCAVPRTLDRGAGIAPSLAAGTPDDIYKINVLTGEKAVVAQPIVSSTIDQLVVSADGRTLFWTDSATKSLNKMDL